MHSASAPAELSNTHALVAESVRESIYAARSGTIFQLNPLTCSYLWMLQNKERYKYRSMTKAEDNACFWSKNTRHCPNVVLMLGHRF